MPESTRVQYIHGLRLLANLLADHDDVPLPFDGTHLTLNIFPSGEVALGAARALVVAMDSPKVAIEGNEKLAITGRVGGVRVRMIAPAADVCEYRVTGVHKASDGSVHEVKEWAIPASLQPGREGDRPDLAHVPHSITVEGITPYLRRDTDLPAEATRVVVERHAGRLAKICTSANDAAIAASAEFSGSGFTIEDSARATASTYGATYVPAVPVKV